MSLSRLEQYDVLLTESQSNLHDTIAICRQLLAEKASFIAWQHEAVETLARWARCLELVPSSRLPPGARAADCVYAYIDHLQNEVAAQRDEIRRLLAALQTYGEEHAATEEAVSS